MPLLFLTERGGFTASLCDAVLVTPDMAGGHTGEYRLALLVEQPHPQEMDGGAPALNIGPAIDAAL